jgi:hypothetical protein
MIVPVRDMAEIEAPKLVRAAEIACGTVFVHAVRPLRVVKVTGSDPAAPVILEELASWGDCLAGQLALWSADGVLRAINNLHQRDRA